MYEMLSNQRRRYTIHYLKEREESVKLGTLAEQIGAWEQDTEPHQLSSADRKTVYTALQQRHLPKMDEAEIVAFDKRSGTIEPTDGLDDVDIYTEVVPSGEFPWSHYYLGLSAITLALLSAVWAGVYPLTVLPDIAWAVFCATALTVSSVVHALLTREMKLGETTQLPEQERTRE